MNPGSTAKVDAQFPARNNKSANGGRPSVKGDLKRWLAVFDDRIAVCGELVPEAISSIND